MNEIQVISNNKIINPQQIIEQIKLKYGSDVNVTVTSKGTKSALLSENKKHSNSKQIAKYYDTELDKIFADAEFRTLFNNINDEISKQVSIKEQDNNRYCLKSIKSKNILSFNEFELQFDANGITTIRSFPENQGGKSNLLRIIKLGLFGEFYRITERNTLENVLNKHSPLNYGFIECEVDVCVGSEKVESLVINREFTKNKSQKVTQKVSIRNNKNVQISEQELFKLIGNVKQFYLTSFFDTFSVEKWLQTKPTERYRLFVTYFGLEEIEEKYNLAKKMYDAWFKKSKIRTGITLSQLEKNINQLELENININDVLLEYEVQLNGMELLLTQKKDVLYKTINRKNAVPELIVGLDENEITKQIENCEVKLKALALESSLGYDESIEELQKQLSELDQQIISMAIPLNMTQEKQLLEYNYNNINVVDIQNKISNQTKIVDDLRSEWSNLALKIKELQENKNSFICNNCGYDNVIESEKKLNDLKIKQSVIKQSGIEANVLLQELILERDTKVLSEKTKIGDKIKKIDQDIQEYKQRFLSEINAKKELCNKKIFILRENERISDKILILEKELVDLKNKKKILFDYNKIIESNKDIEEEISKQKEDIFRVEQTVLTKRVEIETLKKDLLTNSDNVVLMDGEKKLLEGEFLIDAVYNFYIRCHSKSGVSLNIINSFLGDINEGMQSIINADFKPYISVEDDSILFLFDRDETTFNMNEGSGYEKTIMSLVLHLLLVKNINLPVSNIIMMDEVFTAISDTNITNVFKILNAFKDYFDNILLVSHWLDSAKNDLLSEHADNTIQIKKINNISKIIN